MYKILAEKKTKSDFESTTAFFILQEATKRTINVNGENYFLSFPDVLFKCDISQGIEELDFYCTELKVAFFEDGVFFSPSMLSIDYSLSVCMPDDEDFYYNEKEAVVGALNSFWNSEFNYETCFCIRQYSSFEFNEFGMLKPSSIDNYLFLEFWKRLTKTNPNWVPKLKNNFIPLDEDQILQISMD